MAQEHTLGSSAAYIAVVVSAINAVVGINSFLIETSSGREASGKYQRFKLHFERVSGNTEGRAIVRTDANLHP
jgi:hypothetical protein